MESLKGENGKMKSDLEQTEIEAPYELPEGWKWCRLGEVCKFENGYAFKSDKFSKEGIPVIGDIYTVTKTCKNVINGYAGFYFGTEWFNLMSVEDTSYHNYYISKHGAIFYTKENIFIPYNLSLTIYPVFSKIQLRK